MFNFSSKKNKEETTNKESVKLDDDSLKSVPETPEPPKQVIDLESLENQPKMQDFGSDEPLPQRPKSPEKESGNFQSSDDDDVSFEVPDFTEDDINMNIDLKDIAGIKDSDSNASSEDDVDLNSQESDTPLPDKSTPDDSFAEEEPEKGEVLEDFAEEEPEKGEVLEDFAEEEPEKEEVLEAPEETEDESSEDLPIFDSNDDSWEDEKDEPLPKFEVKDEFGPKFLSKNKYKQLVSSLMSFEKTLDETTDLSEDFTKTETSVKKHSKDLEKNISLVKEKIIEVDKRIFI